VTPVTFAPPGNGRNKAVTRIAGITMKPQQIVSIITMHKHYVSKILK